MVVFRRVTSASGRNKYVRIGAGLDWMGGDGWGVDVLRLVICGGERGSDIIKVVR